MERLGGTGVSPVHSPTFGAKKRDALHFPALRPFFILHGPSWHKGYNEECRTTAPGGFFAGEGVGATFSCKEKDLVFTNNYEILRWPATPSE